MSNADDRCAYKGCGLGRQAFQHREGSEYPDAHAFVEPAPQPAPSGDACHCGHPFTARCKSTAPSGDEAKVLNMDDETLVAEIAFEVAQATKQQPDMGGRCRRLHDDTENRRIARAAIRAINRIARRGSEGK